MTISLHDHVRSFDFEPIEGRPSSYIEGVVVAIIEAGETLTLNVEGETHDVSFPDCARYAIRATKHVHSGEVSTNPALPRFVFPPVNGTPKLFGDVCNGVEKVS